MIKIYEEMSDGEKNKIGEKSINLAEYALKGAFSLEVELDGKK